MCISDIITREPSFQALIEHTMKKRRMDRTIEMEESRGVSLIEKIDDPFFILVSAQAGLESWNKLRMAIKRDDDHRVPIIDKSNEFIPFERR